MAADNITLGRFQLSGIPAAPRGIPQIEVTFDIDANGIVNVSAKDLGTGKEQKITITSSSKLSDEEIQQKVKEAEQYAEADKAKKAAIEARNQAETLVYETEKTLKELEGKIDEAEKNAVIAAKEELSKALEGNDTEEIKAKTEALTSQFHALSAKLYQQAQQAQGAAGAQGAGPDMSGAGQAQDAGAADDVVDGDYREV